MAKKWVDEPWDQRLVRRVGAAMKRARGAKSARWLSDETAALGYRISPTVIAKLDSGHRGSVLTVGELLVLAAALNMPPALLLFPGYPDGDVEFLPGRKAMSTDVVEWFSGEQPMPAYTDKDGERHVSQPNTGTELVETAHEFFDIAERFYEIEAPIQGAVDKARAKVASDLHDRMMALGERVNELRRELEEDQR